MKDSIMLPKNRFIWMLLAFQGGYVNVGGLLTIHLFVSHVTGFAAHFSMSLIGANYIKSLYFLLVPLFFLFGAVFSSLFTEIRKKIDLQPVYIYIMIILSFLFLVVSTVGYFGYFGEFGESFENFRDFILLIILAFSCGAQNAIFTHFSKSIIRTTHLTGLTTDLGIGIAKFLISNDQDEGRMNRVRIEIILSFILGSIFGAILFPKFKFLAFLFPAINSFFVGLRLYRTRIITSHL